jgi:hypothetical protein
MKVFLSQKFRNITVKEILIRRKMLIDFVHTEYDDAQIIENWHPNFDKNSVAQLGQSIIELSEADLVLVSDVSQANISDFVTTGSVKELKGSEIEVLVCASFGIETRAYVFILDENGLAIRVEWV